MPTLRECSANGTTTTAPWIPGNMLPGSPNWPATIDLWTNPYPWTVNGNAVADSATGDMLNLLGARVGEDVILDNCIGFDVKAWDPGAPLVSTPAGLTLAPGDRVPNGQGGYSCNYIDALYASLGLSPPYPAGTNPGTPCQIVGFGAFVDLNYMCRLGAGTSVASPNIWYLPQPPMTPIWYLKPSDAMLPNYQISGVAPLTNAPPPLFCGAGDARSGLRGTPPDLSTIQAAVYDTGSDYYESATYKDASGNTWQVNTGDYIPDPTANPPKSKPKRMFQEGVNAVDDNSDSVKDDPGEKQAPPPYAQALQAIQVKIRVLEPDTKQVREVTVVQKFY
jgi:hypothetical protein